MYGHAGWSVHKKDATIWGFNQTALDEAQWVLQTMEKENFLVGLVAQICVQKGAEEVNSFLESLRKRVDANRSTLQGLKGARFVFMAWENQADDACLDPKFLEGLEALGKAGLLWEFCCEPRMAPYLPSCNWHSATEHVHFVSFPTLLLSSFIEHVECSSSDAFCLTTVYSFPLCSGNLHLVLDVFFLGHIQATAFFRYCKVS